MLCVHFKVYFIQPFLKETIFAVYFLQSGEFLLNYEQRNIQGLQKPEQQWLGIKLKQNQWLKFIQHKNRQHFFGESQNNMKKKLIDAGMIFSIGMSPIGFEYLKQNISSTKIIDRIQSDVDKLSQKEPNPFLRKHYNVKELVQAKQQTKINPKVDLIIQRLKKWKSETLQKYIKEVSIVAGLHTIGGLLFPTPFFLSIVGYFVLYQVNFMNDFYIIQGRGAMFQTSKFSFDQVNQAYMFIGGIGLAIAGVNKGLSRLSKNAANDMFK